MIVCNCRAVSERELRCAVEGGACDLEDVRRACGAGGVCGGCIPTLVEVLVGLGCSPAATEMRRRPFAAA